MSIRLRSCHLILAPAMKNMESSKRVYEAKRVTWIGFFVNLFLSAGKIIAGIVGHSSAMIADGVHSLSDFVTDLIVIVFIGVSGKGKDENHQYGHGKFETFATMLISFALFIVAVGIFWVGAERVWSSLRGEVLERPGRIALIAAVISIFVKEILYHYTVRVGKRIGSSAVIANGWHHRSDAFSSVGTLAGIAGAMFLGEKWRILDPIASLVVSFFIVKVAYHLAMPSINELLEQALPKDVEKEIGEVIMEVPGVKCFHNLKTRKNGNTYIIDVHIMLNRRISFIRSHDIATEVENILKRRYGIHTQVGVHTEPYLAGPQGEEE